MRAERRTLLLLAAAAVCLAGVQAATGEELVFYAGPLLLIAGLLLSGRFIGERRILALRTAPAPARARARQRWSHTRDRALASLLERSPRLLRGPPAPLAA